MIIVPRSDNEYVCSEIEHWMNWCLFLGPRKTRVEMCMLNRALLSHSGTLKYGFNLFDDAHGQVAQWESVGSYLYRSEPVKGFMSSLPNEEGRTAEPWRAHLAPIPRPLPPPHHRNRSPDQPCRVSKSNDSMACILSPNGGQSACITAKWINLAPGHPSPSEFVWVCVCARVCECACMHMLVCVYIYGPICVFVFG